MPLVYSPGTWPQPDLQDDVARVLRHRGVLFKQAIRDGVPETHRETALRQAQTALDTALMGVNAPPPATEPEERDFDEVVEVKAKVEGESFGAG